MKIQFEDLDYQGQAIDSILHVFDGHKARQSNFTIGGSYAQYHLLNEYGVSNQIIFNPNRLLDNVQQVQIANQLPLTEHLPAGYPQFNIEMETGTGKTFVYLKSILEMNQKYGFTKFIIVVPSIAIKEGVFKSIEMTRETFKKTMNGMVYRAFMYDSSKLENVDGFARNETVEIMVINIQSFSKRGKATDNLNIIYRDDMDSMNGIRPIDLIAETNPVVIIDEPQSVDNTENAKEAIAALNPSVTFRFSATHKQEFPLLYKLGPVEAYQKELVKQIEVAGFSEDIDPNEAYFKLVDIKATKKTISATVEMNVRTKNGVERKQNVKLKQDDDLYLKSKRLEPYESLGFVREISAEPGNEYIELSGGKEIYRLSEAERDDRLLKRAQIQKTIEEHLDKELKLNPKGIKVLSLFFIDQVDKYRQYDENNEAIKGEYARIFEEEYQALIKREKYQSLRDREVPVEEVHDGYFAVDSKQKIKNTTGTSKADESAYQIIMKDKEDLLTFYDEEKGNTKRANKLRFIFSHSALKEGWDNPNVFQICTLVETKDTLTKRQKIGRGLRIAVNQEGERVPGFETNVLTVMANESYQQFATDLQQEYESEGVQFGLFTDNIFSSLIVGERADGTKSALGLEKSRLLVQYMQDEGYIDKKRKGTEKLAQDLKDQSFKVPEEIAQLALGMSNRIIQAIEEKFHSDKVEIKDRRTRVSVKLNKQALTGPFLDLWERINEKTRYSISFDSKRFIEEVSNELSLELQVKRRRIDYSKAQVGIAEAGIDFVEEESGAYSSVDKVYTEVPDILTYLQNETRLTRQTIIKILKKSDTLRDFKRNPQEYMTEVARIINAHKRVVMVDGIKYEKIGETYDQSLLEADEIDQYADNTLEVHDDRYPYNYVVYDSETERNFAVECEHDRNVKCYIKLPSNFKVPTPLGNYNPDWAVLIEQDKEDKLYFVVETKGTTDTTQLRSTEQAKIKCGRKHFDAIDSGLAFKVSTNLRDVY
ncbi:type III restriction-modification system endonuclease [Aerococcus sanguinicola]|uniref:Restriction endonuclease subunit R n=1 Tax=Aerococcus sanguinicola TaxID=119206 RepID=A0A0X8FB97_9LACT|nr:MULTISPECIES: DEAD/DEAH box helicase family protein [Aerococcus]AMB94173.1 restriction endonuclease subunit R [Aerococcus sanguinicola]MDK7050052.1 DEAD/DEAH box helicase family protein [Aerococcus sanguinicola]OFT92328.1 restriction endonuclease subunit R [Aerococcus sp. HMSC23C02]PKZ22346.1 restriction endonuclease subunit R [Aerococcus sanguinicola]